MHLHDNCNAGDEISGLLSQLGILVVQPPLDDTAELGQVGFSSHLQAIDDCAKAVQHHIGIICHLQDETLRSIQILLKSEFQWSPVMRIEQCKFIKS